MIFFKENFFDLQSEETTKGFCSHKKVIFFVCRVNDEQTALQVLVTRINANGALLDWLS